MPASGPLLRAGALPASSAGLRRCRNTRVAAEGPSLPCRASSVRCPVLLSEAGAAFAAGWRMGGAAGAAERRPEWGAASAGATMGRNASAGAAVAARCAAASSLRTRRTAFKCSPPHKMSVVTAHCHRNTPGMHVSWSLAQIDQVRNALLCSTSCVKPA